MTTINATLQILPDLNSHHQISVINIHFKEVLHNLLLKLVPLLHFLKQKPLVQCYLLPLPSQNPQKQYNIVALGGTFDYFHLGHQILLLKALMLVKKEIVIGVTGEVLLKNKKNKQVLEHISVRMKNVENYIQKVKPDIQITMCEINDPYGPTILRQEIEAIVVSEETLKGATMINEKRKQRNMKELKIQMISVLSPEVDQDKCIEAKLSSSHIRAYILEKNQMSCESFEWYRNEWRKMMQILVKLFKIPKAKYEQISEKWWKTLLTKYSEYWRFYHTNFHIFSILQQYRLWKKQPITDLYDQAELLVSIWFHDIQYQPVQSDNEEVSANMAKQFLLELFQDDGEEEKYFIEKVFYDILATKEHSLKETRKVTKILIDLDMSILNSQWQKYWEYAKKIRLEYEPIAKDAYCTRRIEFLSKLNTRQILFFEKNVENIEENVQKEIQSLKN